MRKNRNLLSGVPLCALILCIGTVSVAVGDAAAMLEEARSFVQEGQFAQARTALQNVTQTYPDKEQAIWAQSDLARMELKLKNDSAAESVIANLKTAYADNAFTAHALHDVAFKYHAMKRFEEAKALYKCVVESWPGNEYEIWALGGLATSSLKLGDAAAGNNAATRLVTDFDGHPDMAIVAHDVATGYVECRDYVRAKEFFTLALNSHPEAEHKMWSLIGLAKVKIRLGEYAEVHAIVDQLISEFSGDQRLPNELNEIAKFFKRASRNEDAEIVYGNTFMHFPGTTTSVHDCLEAAKGYIRSLIESGDEKTAIWAIDTVIAYYQTDQELTGALSNIARRYEQLRKYKEAGRVYRQILDYCSNDPECCERAQLMIRMIEAIPLADGAHDDEAVMLEIDSLIGGCSDNPDLPREISHVFGEQYYYRGLELQKGGDTASARAQFQKAVEIWDKIYLTFPASEAAAEASEWAGCCLHRIGDYVGSSVRYMRVIEHDPTYKNAWNALFFVGRNAELLKESGAMSEEEADAITRPVYEKLITDYPDCKAARYVQGWLNRHGAN